jgi:hypothetical protein
MYSPEGSFAIRTLDGKQYLVPIGGSWAQDAELLELNAVSALIWKTLPAEIDAIIEAIVGAYQIDRATAESDVIEFMEELISMGLVSNA